PAVHGLVGLRERLKDFRLGFRRYSDPGIPDLKTHKHAVLGFFPKRGAHKDFTLLGEFDRIADKIGEYLAEPARIARHAGRNVAVDLADEFESLSVRVNGNEFYQFFDVVAQVEIEMFKLEFACFYFGEIQNIVQDLKERFSGPADRFSQLALLCVKVGPQQKFGHSEH